MKRCFAIIACLGLIAMAIPSCNKHCTCVTTNPAVTVVDSIVYSNPNSKRQCQEYQDNQNSILTTVDGKVTCVYE